MALHIRTRGMKAQDVDVVLPSPQLLLTAPNGSGKSAFLDAIRFAVLGRVPALGKENQRTALLMSGQLLEVDLHLDEGRVIHRRLRATGSGGYSVETECSWLPGKAGSREHGAAAIALFGSDEQSAAEVLDIRELLKLTGPQRAARIEKLLQTDGDPAALVKSVMLYTLGRLTGEPDPQPEHYADLALKVDGYREDGQHVGAYAVLKGAAPDVLEKLKSGIVVALEWLNQQKNETANEIANKRHARAELAPTLQEIPEPDPEEIARLELRRSQLERSIGAIQEQLDQAAEAKQQIADADAEKQAAIMAYQAARTARETFERELAPIRTQRDRLIVVVDEIQGLLPPALLPDSDEIAAARRAVTVAELALQEHAIPAVPTADDAQSTLDTARRRLTDAETSDWAKVFALASEIRTEAGRSAKGKAISQRADQIKAIAGEKREDTTTLAAAVAVAETALAERKRAIAAAETARQGALDREVELKGTLETATATRDRLIAARQQTFDEALQAYNERRAALVLEREELRKVVDLDAVNRRDRETNDAVAVAAANVDAAGRVRGALGDTPADIEPVSAERAAELEETQATLAQLLDAQARHRQLKDLLASIAAAEIEATVFSALEHGCRRSMADEVARQRGPLVELLDRYLKAAGRPEGAYVHADRTATDFGWRHPDHGDVSIATLCGAEGTLYAAGLCAAVNILRGAPVRIVLVEAADLDPSSLQQLLAGLGALAPDLTAVIVAHWYTPRSLPEGWVARTPTGERVQRQAEAA